MNNDSKSQAYSQGILVLIGLGVLTGLEFYLAKNSGSTISLSVIAILKAGIIMQYFMHIGRVGGEEGTH